MIFGPCKAIAESKTLLLADSVFIEGVHIVELLQLTRSVVRVTSQVGVFASAVCVCRTNLTTDNGGFDFNLVDAEAEIVGVQHPNIRHIMRCNVGSCGGGSNIKGTICAFTG